MIFYYLVKVLSHNLHNPLIYSSEKNYEDNTFVFFELKKNTAFGIIIQKTTFNASFETHSIKKDLILSKNYKKFLQEIESFYLLEEHEIVRRILKIPSKKSLKKSKISLNIETQNRESKRTILNKEQEEIFNKIINLPHEKKKTFLLKGVTGSGKTFLFFKLIEHYVKIRNESVICLFPNTHLAQTVAQEMKNFSNELPLFQYHCQAEKTEKMKVWERIFEEKISVIFGVHLPAFLPLINLGICIIDEEHDSGYQDSQAPYLNSKDCISIRTKIANIPLLLASATPSASSIYQSEIGAYSQGTLTKKFHTASPPNIISLKLENKKEILSDMLQEMIKENLKKKEQTILFVQRKGFFLYASCSTCKQRIMCSNCSIPLTIYANHIGKCNHCKQKKTIPEFCQFCKEKTKIKKIGCGIDQVFKKVEELFPEAKIKQIESESLKKKEEAKELIKEINEKEYDIIIGTQVLIKGYNFFHVSLVGIIQADNLLQIPFYKNTEEMIQQIIQVSGRAGRTGLPSSIVIQSFTEHNLDKFFEEKNYNQFIIEELEYRKELHLPPFKKLAILLIKSKEKEIAKKIAGELYETIIKEKKDSTEIFKPANPIHEKIKNYFYQTITIKAEKYKDMTDILKNKLIKYKNKRETKVFYIPNPIHGSYE